MPIDVLCHPKSGFYTRRQTCLGGKMSLHALAPGEALYFEHSRPTKAGGVTFVFVNALTGSTATWEPAIGTVLRDAGHGTLVYDFRGQGQSVAGSAATMTPTEIVDDLVALLASEKPDRPVLVGLSIGGLFAAQAYLAGAEASGLVLINTLRKPTPRLEWINTAMVHAARTGGSRLIMEMNLPQLVNPEQLAAMRPNMFPDAPYEPMAENDGLFRLMAESVAADWDLAYEKLNLPVLLQHGLHDRVFRVEADVAELTARMPDVGADTFEDAGHLIPVERPDAFVRSLLRFADGIG